MDTPSPTELPAHVADLVRVAAAARPTDPAVVDVALGREIGWADLAAATSGEAARLRAAGVRPGDRVVIRLGGGAPFCVAVLGALHAGAVAVPVGPLAVRRELDVVLGDCTPCAVVAPAEDTDAAAAAEAVGASVLGTPNMKAAAEDGPPTGGGEDIALLVYTSRTPGGPQGVPLSHRALLANRAQTAALRPVPVTSVDRALLALPLFHVVGLAAGFLQVCWAGATAVLLDRFEPENVADVIARHRVSTLVGVPSMYRGLLGLPPDRLRACFAGVRLCTAAGAPLPPRWLTDFQDVTGLPIFEGYGLAEAGPVVTTTLVGGTAKPGSVGRPLPGVELRLVDAEGNPLETAGAAEDDDVPGDPAEDTGFVALRGPNLFSGYWPDGSGGPDADGWFTTADVGFLDDDGDLHLVDRSSDLVIVNGFNVYPREVEEVLAELDGVVEAAVVGKPDDRTGEAVKAVVVPAAGVPLTEDAVREHCAARLARFKVPTVVTFVDALPRTPTGKVARRLL